MSSTRRSDPVTSHEAEARLKDRTREKRRILSAFLEVGDMTDSELESLATAENWPHAGSTYYRRRRSDLKAEGKIYATSERRKNQAGNSETVWGLAPAPLGQVEESILADARDAVFARLDDGTFVLKGVGLVGGSVLTVHAKSGHARRVIVRRVTDHPDGTSTASFDWAPTKAGFKERVVFVKHGQIFYVRGKNLVEGARVDVSVKGKRHTRPVVVERIVHRDEAGYQTATFHWLNALDMEGDKECR